MVANEADADVRIMDPTRAGQNAPENMISPAWITECIKRQQPIDEGPYRVSGIVARNNERRQQEAAQNPPSAERPERSRTHTRPPAGSHKRVRNEYSRQDDQILIRWMRQKAAYAAKKGVDFVPSGNLIYKELEAQVSLPLPLARRL